jgi:hypothetical protein
MAVFVKFIEFLSKSVMLSGLLWGHFFVSVAAAGRLAAVKGLIVLLSQSVEEGLPFAFQS